jgi:hypothetical protein
MTTAAIATMATVEAASTTFAVSPQRETENLMANQPGAGS